MNNEVFHYSICHLLCTLKSPYTNMCILFARLIAEHVVDICYPLYVPLILLFNNHLLSVL